MTTSPKNASRKSVERFENEGGTTRAGELTRKEKKSTEGRKVLLDAQSRTISPPTRGLN